MQANPPCPLSLSNIIQQPKLHRPRQILHILPTNRRPDLPLPAGLQGITRANSTRPYQQPQTRQRGDLRVHVDRAAEVVWQNGVQNRQQAVEGEGRGSEKVARQFAVLTRFASAGARGAAAFLPALAVGGFHEVDLVEAGGVGGGEVGGEEDVFAVIGEVVGFGFDGGGLGGGGGDYRVGEDGLVLEEFALGDEQAAEIACAEVAFVDGGYEWAPQFVADVAETGEVARAALREGIPYCGAEARPEPVFVFGVGFVVVVHIFWKGVFEDVERFAG